MGEKYIPSVTDVIAERKKQNSKPWNRDDPWRVGLVIEGGVMRGVVSGGMVVGLQALDLFKSFDAIYATSAGSCAAMYFSSEQSPEGTSIYYQDLTDGRFINPKKIFVMKPPIDVRFLTHDVMWNRKVLDWQRVLGSPIPIHTYITSAKDANLLDLYHYQDRLDLHNSLLHTSLIPVVAGMPREADGNFFTDGGVLTGGVPLKQALYDGSSHVLVLLTRPDGTTKKLHSIFDPIIIGALRMHGFSKLADKYSGSHKVYERTLERIELSKNTPEVNPQIEAIKLKRGIPEISRVEQDEHRLRQAAFNGYVATVLKFKKYNLPLNEKIQVI